MRLAPLVLLLAGTGAFADSVAVSITQGTPKSRAAVNVTIQEPIAGFKLTLTRGDGKALEVKGGGRPGVTRTIELEQPEGTTHWAGSLTVNLPNGTGAQMPLEFDTTWVRTPLVLQPAKEADLDLPNRRLTLRISRPAARVELKVLMDTGRVAFEGEVPFAGEPAGTALVVGWPEAPGRVLRLDVKAWDTSGFFAFTELYPWSVDIPHDDVIFDSGKAELRPAERPKLDRAFDLISAAVAKYGDFAELRLYVAGHTDTVGPSASNLTLSRQRAQAIAEYLRRKGLRVPISFEGFGEEAPLVPTPDETDEPRNRRAGYTISVAEPAVKSPARPPYWRRL